MTDLTYSIHPADIARLRSSMPIVKRATNMLTFAVVGSLTTATVIMVATLAGSL